MWNTLLCRCLFCKNVSEFMHLYQVLALHGQVALTCREQSVRGVKRISPWDSIKYLWYNGCLGSQFMFKLRVCVCWQPVCLQCQSVSVDSQCVPMVGTCLSVCVTACWQCCCLLNGTMPSPLYSWFCKCFPGDQSMGENKRDHSGWAQAAVLMSHMLPSS